MKEKFFKACATISIAVFSYLAIIIFIIIYFNAPNSYHHKDKRFIIDSGMTLREVVDRLYDEKIIKSPTTFLYISQLIKGMDPKVRYGEYFFEKNLLLEKIWSAENEKNLIFSDFPTKFYIK